MKTVLPSTSGSGSDAESSSRIEKPGRGATSALLPIGLILLFSALAFLPPARGNARLQGTFLAIGLALLVWQLVVWAWAARSGRGLAMEFVSVRSHYVQACVQFSIYLYWGWYWREIYAHLPLIFAQMVFLYILGALLAWSQGRTWRVGFGPLPIILSTNFFMWFRDDWFFLQFAMIATGALGKEFIRWNRDGKQTHIFNPSALGLSLFSLGLILTGTTDYTWARELATTIDAVPHIYLMIFLVGFIVQYSFTVTLMTFSAFAVLCLLNLIYTGTTGVYFFVNTNISAAVFLGLHLLMTDPSTSPRTTTGRTIFGGLYGAAVFVLFGLLDRFDAPVLYAKLLQVPLLNLSVQIIDRMTRSGILGRITAGWESALPPRRLNLVHMACWSVFFLIMLGTGFVGGRHPGNSITFWKKALEEGRPHAGRRLIMATGAQAGLGSGAANNELGLIFMEGRLAEVQQSNARAARYFAKACELGDLRGCENVAIQFLFLRERLSDADLARALDRLEQACSQGIAGQNCFLIGSAYETGRGRALNKLRARELYQQAGDQNLYALKGLARIALAEETPVDLSGSIPALERACAAGDAESCWYLAYIVNGGRGVQADAIKARLFLERACQLRLQQACDALRQNPIPAFARPQPMVVPGWSQSVELP